jgi:hypothetical protein
MSALAIPRPGRHAIHTRLPVALTWLSALLSLLCAVVLEHDSTLERMSTVVSRVVVIGGTAAACILPVVTR